VKGGAAGGVLAALAAVAATQFATVRATNFGGTDEWLCLSLCDRGALSFPHSNRPLTLLWSTPVVALFPNRFEGFLVAHVAYLLLGAWLTWLLVRRLEPAAPALAFLSGVFTLVWVPLDMARLAPVHSMNSGATFATLLAIALLLESWRRGRVALLGLALVVAFLAARTYEATLGLLAGAPLLLAAATPGASARETGPSRLRLFLAWEAGVALLAGLAARPLLEGGDTALYQSSVLGADPNPVRWLGRVARLYALHVGPLVPADPSELRWPGVAVAVAVFLVAAAAVVLRLDVPTGSSRRRLAVLAATALALAGMGYSVLALSPGVVDATRTQFLSAPGIAIFLAATLCLLVSFAPPRARMLLLLVAAGVVVAVGTGHTLAMQRTWDRISAYPAQRQALVAMVREAPSLRTNTLVLLLDEDGAFPYALTFRHAVALVYGREIVGHVVGADPLLYALAAVPDGWQVTPWPVIRGPWRELPTHHRSDEVVVFRLSGGRLRLLERWEDSRLPPLAALARYAPRARIGAPPAAVPAGRRALD
jgi:hypothetical protein